MKASYPEEVKPEIIENENNDRSFMSLITDTNDPDPIGKQSGNNGTSQDSKKSVLKSKPTSISKDQNQTP